MTLFKTCRIAFFAAAILSLSCGCRRTAEQTQPEGANPTATDNEAATKPTTDAIATQAQTKVSRDEAARIRELIGGLKWSRPVGATHTFFQIPGNDSAKKLVEIGKPAIPFLVEALTQVERTSPLLTRKHVAAVAVLGKIGDPEAVPGILNAMEENRHDPYFLREGVLALKRIGDRRAIPKLMEIAELSFAVSAAREAIRGGAEAEEFPEDVQWWLADRGMATVEIEILLADCLVAISSIDPAGGMEVAAKFLDASQWEDRAAASVALLAAAEADPSYRNRALQLLTERQKVENHPGLKELLAEAIAELKSTSRPAPEPAEHSGG